jgi:hypothetical protein
MDGRDVELWERGRFIVRLSSDLISRLMLAAWGAAVCLFSGKSLAVGRSQPVNECLKL